MRNTVVMLVTVLALAGCKGSMTPGKMAWVQTRSDTPRAGNAYLVRGFIGLFSHGIDELTEQINESGVRAHVFQEDQHKKLAAQLAETYRGADEDTEPLVIIGHSYGADDVVKIARALDDAGVRVDLLITLDPTARAIVPKNVVRCVNFYQPSIWDATPVLRGVALKTLPGAPSEQLVNLNLRGERKDLLEWDTNHVNIDKNSRIHVEVVKLVLGACPPRETWALRKHGKESVAARTLPGPAAHSNSLAVSQTSAPVLDAPRIAKPQATADPASGAGRASNGRAP
ncbi:MAG: hypothetical protein ACREIT_04910 [Tepidisphaeraceae bacterium]